MTNSSDLASQLGAALGPGYRVERALGEGGFAVVFLVKDLELKRDLAVKVLSPDMITSKVVLERFRREAETIAGLSHPNIVPLHFIGGLESLLYLAMQCVDGGSIADRLKREGRLPVADVVRVMSEVASALAHAHKRGVIHRDIKPANVLIDADSGRALVTDFGIARSGAANGLTATGMVIGTAAYLSPEQITGDTVDHRVDIYALGVMGYEMLAGRVPFDGATPTAAMMKRLAGPPAPISMVRPDVPAELEEVIAGCLAAEPHERIQSAAEVVRALGRDTTSTAGRATQTIGAPKRAQGTRWLVPIVATLSIVASVAAWLTYGRNGELTNARTDSASSAQAISDETGLVSINAGDYVIGNDAGPLIVRPKHATRVAAFRIERTEVTVNAYAQFIDATKAPVPWAGAKPMGTMPVTRVTWDDAARYCAWKYPGAGRLPTEVEWEAAARGAAGRLYPYGDAPAAAGSNTASAGRSGPVPVGSFTNAATPEGVQDMSGNVWEWTSSILRAYPGAEPLPDSMAQYRVIRGGAFDSDERVATAWTRGYLKVSSLAHELPNTGFRCVTAPKQ